MSDQPGVPALTVFPPFNPAASRPAPAPAEPSAPEPAFEEPTGAAAGPESTDFLPAEPASAGPQPAAEPESMPWDAEPAGLEAPDAAEPTGWDAAPAEPAPEPAAPWEPKAAAEDERAPWDAEPADQPAAGAEPPEPGLPAVELDYAGDPALWTSEAEEEAAEPLPWDYEAPELQTPEAAEAAAEDEREEEDLPWLELPSSAPEMTTAAEAPAEPSLEPVPDWMGWAGAGEETAAPAEDRAEPDVPPIGDLQAAEPGAAASDLAAPFAEPETTSVSDGGSWAPPSDEGRSDAGVAEWAHPEPAPGPAAGAGGFEDVAARLESIARALRDDPQGFLAGASGGGDPLSLLVAGFAMGVGASRRQGHG